MTTLNEDAQQALDDMEMYSDCHEVIDDLEKAHGDTYYVQQAVLFMSMVYGQTLTLAKLLREALTPPPGQASKPVAWMHTNGVGHRYFRLKPQDPVFMPVPLYTRPSVALSDEQIDSIIGEHATITDPNLRGAVYMMLRDLEQTLMEQNQ